MTILLLLIIAAILLFGSSVIVGAIGWGLGFLVAAAALAYASIVFDLEPIWVLIYGVGGLVGACLSLLAIAKLLEPFEKARVEKKIAELEKESQQRARDAMRSKVGRLSIND